MRLAIGAGVAAVVLVMAGCSSQGGSPNPSPSRSTPSASSTATLDLEQFTAAPSGVVDEDTGQTVSPRAVPTWDQASRRAVTSAAATVMTTFARPDLSFDDWWAPLSPLLTQQAQQDYSYVDPANVPAHAVTGAPQLVDETSAYVAAVTVPTDVGTYTLVLTRADATAPWLTSRLTPPDGVQ